MRSTAQLRGTVDSYRWSCEESPMIGVPYSLYLAICSTTDIKNHQTTAASPQNLLWYLSFPCSSTRGHCSADCIQFVKKTSRRQWRRERGECAPGGTMQGATIRSAKIWNSEIWPLLANWRFALQTVITPPNTSPSLGTTASTVSAPRPHTNQCVQKETYTADLTDHSPAVTVTG